MILYPEPPCSVPGRFLFFPLRIVTVFGDNSIANLPMFVLLDKEVLQSEGFQSAQCLKDCIGLYHSFTCCCAKRTRPQGPGSNPSLATRHRSLDPIAASNLVIGPNDGVQDCSSPTFHQLNCLIVHVSSLLTLLGCNEGTDSKPFVGSSATKLYKDLAVFF